MKFVLALLLVFSTVFDACLASTFPEHINISEQHSQVSESSADHESHDHQDHDLCQQCHSCHHVVIFKTPQNISQADTSVLEIPYQFFIPSAFIKLLKRPPKV